MKKLLLFIFILCVYTGRAQNWQCLQPGVKHYFTNSNGYIRGIRIDSVKTYADSVVYYPFHTPRGAYYSSAGSTTLDSTGGSWLGKRVQQLNDGTFLFDNLWGDTVVIKTRANVGDSWIFCRDTSSLFYRADLIAVDTLTILGSLDSVKTILITARSSSGIVATDPVDSFRIIFSKNNGFVQVCDLYMFPYHKPDITYATGLDYFLDRSANNFTVPYSLINLAASGINKSTQCFNLVGFQNATMQQLYNWSVGDVYEYAYCFGMGGWESESCDPASKYSVDSVYSKNITSANTQCNYSGVAWTIDPASVSSGPPYFYDAARNSGGFIFDKSTFVDTAIMPEEFNARFIYYYFPIDTSYCINSSLYCANNSNLSGAVYYPPFEGPFTSIIYKGQLGLVHYYSVTLDGMILVNDTTLLYYSRGGNICGGLAIPPTKVNDIKSGHEAIQLFPNPANDELTINTTTKQSYTITLTNSLGQIIKTISANQQQQTVNTSNIPPGVYTITITGEDGNRYNEKVVIVH